METNGDIRNHETMKDSEHTSNRGIMGIKSTWFLDKMPKSPMTASNSYRVSQFKRKSGHSEAPSLGALVVFFGLVLASG